MVLPDSIMILPRADWDDYDEETDAESRAFYESCDSILTFTGKLSRDYFVGPKSWYALDLRLKSVDVIALEYVDPLHPEGSSINDMCQIWYKYKCCTVIRPLSDIEYGAVMITDMIGYIPEETTDEYLKYGDALYIKFYGSSDRLKAARTYPLESLSHENWPEEYFDEFRTVQPMPRVEVHIKDAFGREFAGISPESE